MLTEFSTCACNMIMASSTTLADVSYDDENETYTAMLPRGSANICGVVLIVLHQSVSTMNRLGVCKYNDDDLYDICRQLG